jgi:two-component system, LytTR family, sensor kinase
MKRPTLVVRAFVFWTGLGLFFAAQTYLLGDDRVSWTLALRWAMPQWYAWGLLTPGIAAAERRVGRGRQIGTRLALQLPLGIVWTLLAIAMCLCVRPLLGLTWPLSIRLFVVERFNWDLLIYAVIAGVAIARDFARQARDGERDVHRLQLESVALQRHLAEARLQSLRSQLQPHFLFNALNTMSALTETDPKTARRLIEQLGQLLRMSLRHASTPLVTLAEELTFLDDYLAIETTRFAGRITVSVRADDDTLDALVPSFLLQPLVENAIRHGVGPRLSGGHIAVTAMRQGPQLRLRVQDDGLGLRPDWMTRRDAGVGLRNTAGRLEQLYPGVHSLHIVPGAPGAGVEVQLDLPWQQSPQPVVMAG